ncbi:MAG TPA: hypothetical protein VNU45_12705 [Rummeliibacillus sp.]|nr:hypothetical protein [Rummeliibacillus sp.]
MNKLTEKQIRMLLSLTKPAAPFSEEKKILDDYAKELGFQSHDDFLTRTGLMDKFSSE